MTDDSTKKAPRPFNPELPISKAIVDIEKDVVPTKTSRQVQFADSMVTYAQSLSSASDSISQIQHDTNAILKQIDQEKSKHI